MTPIASHITVFLKERLPLERGASVHTCEAYAYTFKLLFSYASERLKVAPSQLHLEQLNASLVVDFLNHLERVRANTPKTRNLRLAAIRSFLRFMEYRVPTALEQIGQILAIPVKITETRMVDYLTRQEMQCVLDAPDPATRGGIRDQAMLSLCYAAGLRVSELIGLCRADLKLQPEVSVSIHGKGRKQRVLPLWKQTATALRGWLAVRGEAAVPELFINGRGEPLTRSGFEYILHKHVAQAARNCPSLLQKRVSPHVLRHSCALMILQATKDLRKVSLWLGHSSMQTTEMYTRADPDDKLETIRAMPSPALRTGRFKATDQLLASLKPSQLCRVKLAKQAEPLSY